MKKRKEMAEEITIDAFKAGDYPQGSFGAKELSEIESTYNPSNYEAPILIGHISDPSYKGKSAIPAFGWIGGVKKVGDHLKFTASQFSDELKSFIQKGFYKKVSAAFYEPTDKANPTPGKWHLHHLAFLGGTPPAIKGLEQIAFADMRGVGIEFAEMDASVSVDGAAIEVVEKMGVEDTLKDCSESCASFLAKIEEALTTEIDYATAKQRCSLAASDMSNEIYSTLNMQWMFKEKLENIEEHGEAEMSEKKTWLTELAEKLHLIKNKQKENIVDSQKEKEYTDKIGALELQLKEFTDAKALADTAALKAVEDAKEATLKAEIKTFCDAKIIEVKMTPAMREKDEPIMFTLGRTNPDALKAFQEKYSEKVVPLEEVLKTQWIDSDQRPQVIKNAESYVKSHPKEFQDMTPGQAISNALYLHSIHKIQFEVK